ncbi:MAG TPA: methyltransferase domain-containing protein [Rhizomicrobium sp.]|jgi:SAM-dependent methyltransferase|nr:methyltransferase domain-containing protein [Rhizomicrobium sp.]
MGQRTRRLILRRVRQFWPELKGRRVLGYGFTRPYLRAFLGEAERCIAAVPGSLGTSIAWPKEKCLTTLTEEDALPFPDAFFDLALVVHGLEEAEGLRPLLRQVWKVLAPEGRLLIVAPNRASLWAQLERSPFGHGRPFSHTELDQLLRGAMFVPEQWQQALYAPPIASRMFIGSGMGWERFGGRFFPALGGVHIAEASKSLYAPAAPTRARAATRAQLKTAGTE